MKNRLNIITIAALIVASSAIANETDMLSAVSNGSLEAGKLGHLNIVEMSQISGGRYTYHRKPNTQINNTIDLSLNSNGAAININDFLELARATNLNMLIR